MRCLYGIKETPRYWFKKSHDGLLELSFESNSHDQSLLIYNEKNIILLLYTDDCLLFYQKDENLKMMVLVMKGVFHLTEQDVGNEMFAYLGL